MLPAYELTGTHVWVQPKYNRLLELGVTEKQLLGIQFIRSIKTRVVDRDASYIAIVSGPHRVGKSTTAILVCSMLDKTFLDNLDKRLIYSPAQLVAAIKDLDAKGIRGGAIVVDEASLSLGSANQFDDFSKVLGKMIDVMGYLRPIILMCLPVSKDVLAKVRRLTNAYWKIERWDKTFTCVTAYDLKYNPIKEKMYFKKPVIEIGGQQIHLRRLIVGKPPEWIVEKYEAISAIRKPAAIKELAEQMDATQIKAVKKTLDIDALIRSVVEDKTKYLSKRSSMDWESIDTTAVRFRLKVPNELAKHIKNEAERILNAKKTNVVSNG